MIIFRKLFLFLSWIISFLPFWILKIKSYFLYLVLHYIIRYRKKVVTENLRLCFPNKTAEERKKISKKFYRNLTDLFFEILKLKTISAEELNKRFEIMNPEILNKLYSQNRSILVAIGHCGNWEWLGPLLASQFQFKVFGPAKPLNDPFFNKFMNSIRSRFGFEPIHFKLSYRTLLRHKNIATASLMAGDQNPVKSEQNYWSGFLNRETPFFDGIEKMAKALDLAVIYFDVQRKKRGYYQAELHLITDSPNQCAENQIIDEYIRLLENSIVQHPDNWLWSHRRWKYKKEANN
ncbi:MAG: lysophospholipid acyltransferase family protein [Bacteroidetes bacterium]|nr:lysophospholipid acyltransferase family protein [Bacteroidota bacterium]